jgi:quercetin dioxygenase-like cupin family protein
MKPQPFHRRDWGPLAHEGCRNVDHKVLLVRQDIALALLRFSGEATIHQHSARFPIDVFCLDGQGHVLSGEEAATISAGEWLRWPAGVQHRLWTDGSSMTTLMVEHVGQADDG